MFHILGLINPVLRTAKLPSELFNKKNKTINVRIGAPISVSDQNEFSDISQYGRFLRSKTYALGSSLELKNFYRSLSFRLQKPEELIDPIPANLLQSEIEGLKPNALRNNFV